MATARQAASSLLGTVTNTANMISSTVQVASDSIDMLHSYVNKHRTMQVQKNIIELDNFQGKLIEETALENIERREKIEDFLNKKPERTAKYGVEYDRIRNLLNPNTESETQSS